MADTDVIQKAFSFGYTWAKLVSWWESVGAGKKCTFSLLNWPFDFSHRSATHTKESQAGGLVRDQCLVCRDWQLKVPAACPSQLQISENWEWFFYLLSLFFHPISLTRVFRGKGHCPQNGNGVPVGGWRRHHSPSLMGPTITKTSQEVLCHHTFSFTPVYPMDLGWGFFASPSGHIFGELRQDARICGAVFPHEVIPKMNWFGCLDMFFIAFVLTLVSVSFLHQEDGSHCPSVTWL